jgi:hypothetical protein
VRNCEYINKVVGKRAPETNRESQNDGLSSGEKGYKPFLYQVA